MAGKKLWELTMGELNYELEMAGIVGVDSESLAVIKLTMHLVRRTRTFLHSSSRLAKKVALSMYPQKGRRMFL